MVSGGEKDKIFTSAHQIPICPTTLPQDCQQIGVSGDPEGESLVWELYPVDSPLPEATNPPPFALFQETISNALKEFKSLCRSKEENALGNYSLFVCRTENVGEEGDEQVPPNQGWEKFRAYLQKELIAKPLPIPKREKLTEERENVPLSTIELNPTTFELLTKFLAEQERAKAEEVEKKARQKEVEALKQEVESLKGEIRRLTQLLGGEFGKLRTELRNLGKRLEKLNLYALSGVAIVALGSILLALRRLRTKMEEQLAGNSEAVYDLQRVLKRELTALSERLDEVVSNRAETTRPVVSYVVEPVAPRAAPVAVAPVAAVPATTPAASWQPDAAAEADFLSEAPPVLEEGSGKEAYDPSEQSIFRILEQMSDLDEVAAGSGDQGATEEASSEIAFSPQPPNGGLVLDPRTLVKQMVGQWPKPMEKFPMTLRLQLAGGIAKLWNEIPGFQKIYPPIDGNLIRVEFIELAVALLNGDKATTQRFIGGNQELAECVKQAQSSFKNPRRGFTRQARRALHLQHRAQRARATRRLIIHRIRSRTRSEVVSANVSTVTLPRGLLNGVRGFASAATPLVGLDVAEHYHVVSSGEKSLYLLGWLGGLTCVHRFTPAHVAILLPPFEMGRMIFQGSGEAVGLKPESLISKVGGTLAGLASAESFLMGVGKGAGASTLREAHLLGRQVLQESIRQIPNQLQTISQTVRNVAPYVAALGLASLKTGMTAIGAAVAGSAAAVAASAVALGGATFAITHYSGFGKWAGDNIGDWFARETF